MKYFGLIWSALFRKPVRGALTFSSIFIAFLLFGLLQSVSVAFSQGPEFTGIDRMVVAPRYSIADTLPLSYLNRFQELTAIQKVTHQSWFGGTYKDKANFFPRWAVPPEEYLDMFPEYILPDDQREKFIQTRTGAIIGKSLAEQYDLKVGDKIPLIADIWPNNDSGPWEFDLVGIFELADAPAGEAQMFMNYHYFDEYRQYCNGCVGYFVVEIDDSENAATLARDIDNMFANSANESKTSTEKAYNQMFAKQVGDIGFIMTAILSAVFFTILLLTGNTMAQAIRERTPELAILKTLGVTNIAVLLIVLAESILIALVGAIPGLIAAAIILPGLEQSLLFLGGTKMTTLIVAQGLLLAVLLGLIVGTPPALRAMRLKIVDALGEHV